MGYRITLRKYTNSLKMSSHLVEFVHIIYLNKFDAYKYLKKTSIKRHVYKCLTEIYVTRKSYNKTGMEYVTLMVLQST